MPEVFSKPLCAAVCSGCAVGLESEHMPFSWTGHNLVVDIGLLLCSASKGCDLERADLFL